MTTMTAVVIHDFYDTLDQIQVSELPVPRPEADEILVKVVAVGVNFVDTLYV